MAGTINKVILIGNLGRSPEVRYTQSGSKVATLSIATSERWRDHIGNDQEKTEWHRVIIWGKLADVAEKYLKTGSKVYIEGRLQTRKWKDSNNTERYSTEIIAIHMTMLDGRSTTEQDTNVDSSVSDSFSTNNASESILDDEIPF